MVVAGEDECGVHGGELVEGEAAIVGGDLVVALDEAVEHEDPGARRVLEGGDHQLVEGTVNSVVVVEANDVKALVLVCYFSVVEGVEVVSERGFDVVEGV